MEKIDVTFMDIPLITFDSDKWKDDDEHEIVADEIVEFIKEHEYDNYLIQNKSYFFGDTNSNPIIKINRNDYGGLSGSLKLFIDDIVYDLIPEDDEQE